MRLIIQRWQAEVNHSTVISDRIPLSRERDSPLRRLLWDRGIPGPGRAAHPPVPYRPGDTEGQHSLVRGEGPDAFPSSFCRAESGDYHFITLEIVIYLHSMAQLLRLSG